MSKSNTKPKTRKVNKLPLPSQLDSNYDLLNEKYQANIRHEKIKQNQKARTSSSLNMEAESSSNSLKRPSSSNFFQSKAPKRIIADKVSRITDYTIAKHPSLLTTKSVGQASTVSSKFKFV